MNSLEAPLVLTQVCKEWRELAMGTPHLWSSIHIVALDPYESSAEEIRHHTSRVRAWLRASRPLPLSISLVSDSDYTGRGSADAKFAKTIVGFARRVRVLELNVGDGLFEYFSRHSDWPMLERVVLDSDEFPPEELLATKHTDSDEIWTAPNLKSLEWRSIDSDFLQLPLKWGQVEEISMSSVHPGVATAIGYSPFVLRALLHEAAMIKTLRVTVNEEEDGDERKWGEFFRAYRLENDSSESSQTSEASYRSPSPTPPPTPIHSPVRLNQLTTLDLRDTWIDPSLGKRVTSLLHDTHLPALVSLSYDLRLSGTHTTLPSLDAHPLVSFMRAQAQPCSVKRWTISLTSVCREGFTECLKLMPNLEHLWVKDGGVMEGAHLAHADDFDLSQDDFEHLFPDDELLKMFCVPQPSPTSETTAIICPRLHSVRFDVGDFAFEAFHAFMETRLALAGLPEASATTFAPGAVPLQRFHLTALVLRGTSGVIQKDPQVGVGVATSATTVRFGCKGKGLCTLSDDVERCGLDVNFDVLRDKEGLENVVNRMMGEMSAPKLDLKKGINDSDEDDDWV